MKECHLIRKEAHMKEYIKLAFGFAIGYKLGKEFLDFLIRKSKEHSAEVDF